MINQPPFPAPFVYVLWTVVALVVLVGAFWGAFRWLLARIDERFQAAIESDRFRAVVDRRVSEAFTSAMQPLLSANSALSGQIAVAQKSADAAHRRIDSLEGRKS